jgi:3-dehydroquinate synthase
MSSFYPLSSTQHSAAVRSPSAEALRSALLLCGAQGRSVPLYCGPVQTLPAFLQGTGRRWITVADAGWLASHARPDRSASDLLSWPGSESTKSRESKAALEDQLLRLGVDSETGLCAIGGGALLDLVGFTASTLFRGVPLVLAPTTLLAMVDASVGSKNGINLPAGKNLLGSLYDPLAIWWDGSLLLQLPIEYVRHGMAEIIKHAALLHPDHLESCAQLGHTINANAREGGCLNDRSEGAIWARELAILAFESLQIKDRIVRSSLAVPEERHRLNFGHTVGHALEAASNYTLAHGDAVALGLLVESAAGVALGLLDAGLEQRIRHALEGWAFPQYWPTWDRLVPFLACDKKNHHGQWMFSLPAARPSLGGSNPARCPIPSSRLREVYFTCQSVYA